MTAEDLFLLVSRYGAVVLFVGTFLSCLALPVPSSLLMLAAGAFVVSGDIPLWQAFFAALAGALAGDQAGYAIGRAGGGWVLRHALRKPAARRLSDRAHELADRYGGYGVFLSRWLFSPLGPYVNFIAGAAGPAWLRFTLWAAAGEVIWVTLYLGLGMTFSDQITAVAAIAGNAAGFLATAMLALLLGLLLRERVRRRGRRRAQR
jgi:membrane protein DedA with SNARE-associated domain